MNNFLNKTVVSPEDTEKALNELAKVEAEAVKSDPAASDTGKVSTDINERVGDKIPDALSKLAPKDENLEAIYKGLSREVVKIGSDTAKNVSFVSKLFSGFGELWDDFKDKFRSMFGFS